MNLEYLPEFCIILVVSSILLYLNMIIVFISFIALLIVCKMFHYSISSVSKTKRKLSELSDAVHAKAEGGLK